MFRGRSLKLPAAAFILMLAVGTTGAFSPAAAYDPTDLVQLKGTSNNALLPED
jgi:hypothetical protein